MTLASKVTDVPLMIGKIDPKIGWNLLKLQSRSWFRATGAKIGIQSAFERQIVRAINRLPD